MFYEFRVPLADLDVNPAYEDTIGMFISHGYDGITEHLYNLASAGTQATPETWATVQLEAPESLRSVSSVDIAADFTPSGGDHGIGEITASGQADVVVEDVNDQQTTYAGGSFEMTASLLADNSAGGLAAGEFSGGGLAFRDSGGANLLTGDLIELLLYEVGDNMGMLAGSGLFEVTGGSLQNAFAQTRGEIFQMFFQVTPSGMDNFSAAFTGFTDITITPVPEPASAILVFIGLTAAVRRRRK